MMQAVGGRVPRSKLVSVIQPLRKLVVLRGGATGGWLKAALEDQTFASARVTEAEKKQFLQSILKQVAPFHTLILFMNFGADSCI